jgi:hypothetical protein
LKARYIKKEAKDEVNGNLEKADIYVFKNLDISTEADWDREEFIKKI